MATINVINTDIPIEVAAGGTQKTSFTAYAVITGGVFSGTALQNVSGVGTSGFVLTSRGAGNLPVWTNLPTIWQQLASDPVNPAAGEVWYNTTTFLFRGAVDVGGAAVWVVKADMNLPARYALGGCGSAADALSFGGNKNATGGGSATDTALKTTERYDGGIDLWTVKADLNLGRYYTSGAGTASNGLCIGGNILNNNQTPPTSSVEGYDGSTNIWTTKNPTVATLSGRASCGTASDALVFGGYTNPSQVPNGATDRYNGVVWTAQAVMNIPRYWLQGAGTASDALSMGGVFNQGGGILNLSPNTERYDGIVWTVKANMLLRRYSGAACGTATSALIFGGTTGGAGASQSSTQEYDGVGNTWSVRANLNVGRIGLAGAGTTSDALSFGGYNGAMGGAIPTTERYQGGVSIKTFTVTP